MDRKKNSPLPHHFSKKKYTFYFWGWAIFLSNTISAINLLPVSFALIALHYFFFGAFFFVQEFFRQLPTTTTTTTTTVILFLDSNNLLIPPKQIFMFEKGFLPFAFLWSKVLVAILVALISAILWRRAFFTVFANFLRNINRFEQKNSPRLLTDHKVSMGKI